MIHQPPSHVHAHVFKESEVVFIYNSRIGYIHIKRFKNLNNNFGGCDQVYHTCLM